MTAAQPEHERTGVYITSDVFRNRLREVVEHDLIAGSEAPEGARRRAADLVRRIQADGSDTQFWRDQAGRVLTLCLHAAALSGKTIADVHEWIGSAPDTIEDEIRAHLSASSQARAMLADFEGWLATSDATASGIAATARSALEQRHDSTAMPTVIDESAAIAPAALTGPLFATRRPNPEPVPVDPADYLRPVTQADLDQWPSNVMPPAAWNSLRDTKSPKESR